MKSISTAQLPSNNILSYRHAMYSTAKLAVVMLGSYGYSIELISTIAMINRLPGDRTKNMAAGTLILIIFDTGVVISIASGMVLGFIAKEVYAAWLAMANNPEQESQRSAFRQMISNTIKHGVILALPFAIPALIMMTVIEPI